MQTVWKGAISFGLVHVPVKMFASTEDKDVHFRLIHKACGTPISYVRSCPHCDTKVEWEDIVRGYEYEKGRFVLFDEEELEAIKPESARTIKILDFVSLEEIDPIYFQKTYYLSPDQAGEGAYALLLEAMRQTGRIGIARVAIRSKSSLAAIRAYGDCICMETMFYPDEIRSLEAVPNLPKEAKVDARELDLAKMLIEQLTAPFDASKYTDDYRAAVLDAIQRKLAGQGTDVVAAPAAERTNVIDLMAALQASLEAVKKQGTAEAGRKGAETGGAQGAGAGAGKAAGTSPGAGAAGAQKAAVGGTAISGAEDGGTRPNRRTSRVKEPAR